MIHRPAGTRRKLRPGKLTSDGSDSPFSSLWMYEGQEGCPQLRLEDEVYEEGVRAQVVIPLYKGQTVTASPCCSDPLTN